MRKCNCWSSTSRQAAINSRSAAIPANCGSTFGDAIAHALNDPLERIVLSQHAVDPSQGFVIHYTTIQGMVKMLDKQQMRMYNADQANDPSEGSFFDTHLELPDRLAWAQQETPSSAYIASFIIPDFAGSLQDDLIYWRTYGNDGRGCSLKLLAPASNLYRVQYGAGAVTQTRRALIPVLDRLTPLAELDEGVAMLLSEIVWEALGVLRFLYKPDAYDYERECRVVLPNIRVEQSDILFDYSSAAGNEEVVRDYYEHETLRLHRLFGSGTTVTLGPVVANRHVPKRAVEILTTRMGMIDIPVIDSDVSYRGK